MSCISTGGKLRLSPSSAAKKRASRACMVTTTGDTRYQGGHREETRRGEHDRAPQPQLFQGVVYHPPLAGAQAREHMGQTQVVIERDRGRDPRPLGVEHTQVGFSE